MYFIKLTNMTSTIAPFVSLRYRAVVDISILFFQTALRLKRLRAIVTKKEASGKLKRVQISLTKPTKLIERVLFRYTCAFSLIRDKTVEQTDST